MRASSLLGTGEKKGLPIHQSSRREPPPTTVTTTITTMTLTTTRWDVSQAGLLLSIAQRCCWLARTSSQLVQQHEDSGPLLSDLANAQCAESARSDVAAVKTRSPPSDDNLRDKATCPHGPHFGTLAEPRAKPRSGREQSHSTVFQQQLGVSDAKCPLEADHDAKAALSACEALRQSSSRAQEEAQDWLRLSHVRRGRSVAEQAERAVDTAKAAEAKAEACAADLEKFQQKPHGSICSCPHPSLSLSQQDTRARIKPRHQEVVNQLAKMQKTAEAAEEKIAMAKAEERTGCLYLPVTEACRSTDSLLGRPSRSLQHKPRTQSTQRRGAKSTLEHRAVSATARGRVLLRTASRRWEPSDPVGLGFGEPSPTHRGLGSKAALVALRWPPRGRQSDGREGPSGASGGARSPRVSV